MNEFFSDQQVTQSLQHVVHDHHLTVGLEMSTAGTYRVVQASDPSGALYIIKVLRKASPLAINEFSKETALLHMFAQDDNSPLSVPRCVFAYPEATPPALAYPLVEGTSLGWYYFYIGTIDDLTRIGVSSLVKALAYVQAKAAAAGQIVPTRSSQDLLTALQEYRAAALQAGLPERQYAACLKITSTYADEWLTTPVLVHGDFNPKNILVTPDNRISIIDWSDAYLGGRFMDLAYFWLTCWRQPDFQNELVRTIESQAEFWQTVCYWLPKFYGLLHDTELALLAEFERNTIPVEAKTDNLNYIAQAKLYYADRITTFIANAGRSSR